MISSQQQEQKLVALFRDLNKQKFFGTALLRFENGNFTMVTVEHQIRSQDIKDENVSQERA